MNALVDGFGRTLQYLRLSVTDQCNFRCAYCLPQGCPRDPTAHPLSADEIEQLVQAFAALGVWKVRLTGGEPTLRPDICEIVRRIAATPGVRRIGLTTNGYRLASIAGELRAAGLTSLNVSLDSLYPARYERITGGCSDMRKIVEGIEAAVEAGMPSVKVNAVLLKGMDDDELNRFLAWTEYMPLTVRFIELMQTGENGDYFGQNHVSIEELRQKLLSRGWTPLQHEKSDGPATNYAHEGHLGKAGLIAPYSAGFCASCNRLRASSTGALRLCLFGDKDKEIPLRHLLAPEHHEELKELILDSVQAKPAAHREGRYGATKNLAVTGG